MLVLDDESPDSATVAAEPQLAAPRASRLPASAAPQLARLRGALRRYRDHRVPGALEAAFAAAATIVAAADMGPDGSVPSPGPGARADIERLRSLALAIPDLGELLSCAADEAERAVEGGIALLWSTIGLRGTAPSWTSQEWQAARMVFACACAPAPAPSPARLRESLRTLAAARFASAMCDAFAIDEAPWRRALGDRYDSVRHRCAHRTTWRSRGLAERLRTDDAARTALTARLERWICAGGEAPLLPSELEAALVHASARPRFA